jgi:hypothetical protein
LIFEKMCKEIFMKGLFADSVGKVLTVVLAALTTLQISGCASSSYASQGAAQGAAALSSPNSARGGLVELLV